MTTNAELLNQAMSRLGQRKSTRVRADVVTEINTAIEVLERGTFRPWFLEKTATLAVVKDDTFAALPTDFLIEAEEVRPYFVLEGKVHYLTKRFYGMLVGETPPEVRYYAIRGNDFHFRRPADIAYSIIVPYYAQTNDLLVDDTTDVSNPWLLNAQDWVFGKALGVVAAFHVHNQELAVNFSAAERQAKSDIYIFHEARINENQDFEVGGSSGGT